MHDAESENWTPVLPDLISDAQHECLDYPVIAFTPLALSCAWHTGWGVPAWDLALQEGAKRLKDRPVYSLPQSEAELLPLLATEAVNAEQEVRESLTSANQEKRRLATAAFMNRAEVRPSYTWSRIILLLKAMDLVLLPQQFEAEGGTDRRRPQIPHLPLWKSKGAISPFMESFNKWPSTLQEFLRCWKQAEEKQNDLDVDDLHGSEDRVRMGRTEALRELMKAARETNTRAKLKLVENHFVCAALGLLACTLVSSSDFSCHSEHLR